MSSTKLTDDQLKKLQPLEVELKHAVLSGDTDKAIEVAKQIQALFPNEWRTHHRLLRAKLWAFESCLDANRISYAQRGFIGIRKLSASNTRLYLEASSLLAVCHLRSKDTSSAKKLIKEVIEKINNISSEKTKHQFQKRLIERVEEECILTELIGSNDLNMDIEEIQAKAILLIQRSSDDEIFKLIGNSVPTASIDLLRDVRTYALNQLPAPDRKLLPSPEKVEEPKKVGKATFAVIKRIAWKTFCNPDSTIYKLWKNRVPKLFNEGYFSAAVVTTMSDFKIGIPLLASGISALIMRYTAEEFCDVSKPKGLMIDRGKE
ncbi:tetratricopeptide repeat protein [Rheinheimera faecalis]|uniref:hypothetical protein n=1 Tax=Rheinheimera faecalis TaxID=2901141 RepID=UPI001E2C5C08|nr:hypothetical protein [Rheinheimera faecalis]